MSNNHFSTDIAVIGAGPVGLFAIFQAGMLKMHCHVIDSLDFIGGQCTALYPEKPIYDIPGFPEITAEDLINNLNQQSHPFTPHFHLGQQVIGLERKDEKFFLTTTKGTIIECKAVIIAAGCGAFGPNRPPLDGISEYEGKSIFYLVAKKSDFAGKNIVIAGGGDSAVDWALSLCDVAKNLYLVHRRDKFKAAPASLAKLHNLANNGKIELVIPYQLDSISGNNGQLDTVTVKTLDGQIRNIEADILLPFYGLSMDLGPIANFGLNTSKSHLTVNQTTMQTSVDGIYAIGDIATYENKLKLILTGFSEAATACHSIYSIVYKDQPLHFEYSTTKGIAS